MGPRRLRAFLVACATFLTPVAAAVGQDIGSVDPSPALTSTLAGWTDGHPGTSALVWRLDETGPVEVLSYKATIPRRPASTMKVITAASALINLGPEFRFETRLYAATTSVQTGSTLRGPVYLKGFGDPTLATPIYARRYLGGVRGNIGKLARPVRDLGITRIEGPLVVDETFFDRSRRVASWPARYTAECQPLTAMSVNQSWLGNEHRRYVKSPPRAAGNQLRFAMQAVGVTHAGSVVAGRAPAEDNGRLIATTRSPQLRVISRLMLPDSDNFIAEMLTKNVGAYTRRAGTTVAGTEAAAATLSAIGVLQPGDRFVDGSGLDPQNQVTARTLVSLLSAAVADPAWGAPLIAALPQGGQGTLKRRLRGSDVRDRVWAKTGYISRTSTLTGIVESPSGTRYAFAFLMNQGSISAARQTQDRLVTLLARGVADA